MITDRCSSLSILIKVVRFQCLSNKWMKIEQNHRLCSKPCTNHTSLLLFYEDHCYTGQWHPLWHLLWKFKIFTDNDRKTQTFSSTLYTYMNYSFVTKSVKNKSGFGQTFVHFMRVNCMSNITRPTNQENKI